VKKCTGVPQYSLLFSNFRSIVPKSDIQENEQTMKLSGTDSRGAYGGAADRRRTNRFPVNEELRYRVLHKSSRIEGTGKTLNIGSGGALFTTEEKLPLGRQVEISVNWPARLDGICPLKLVALGRVVRAEQTRAAVRIERYEFRTRASVEAVRTVGVQLSAKAIAVAALQDAENPAARCSAMATIQISGARSRKIRALSPKGAVARTAEAAKDVVARR
jgi:hypothetical protein